MQGLYADKNEKGKLYGAVATVAYVALWALLIYFVSFKLDLPDTEGEGILVNFGNTETGMGPEDLMNSDELADAQTAQESAGENTPEEQLTQDFEEAPAVAPKPKPTPKPKPQPAVQKPAEKPAEPVEKPREVNKKALFPGRSNSNATSEGVAGGEGNQGNLAGSPAGSHTGTGLGNSGNSYNLNGRSLLGALPKPDYSVKEEGRVVIEIRVNQQGQVVSTSFRSVGSTTTNSVLVGAAERAARRAKFNVDETAPFPQVGTIVYNFKMN